MRAMIESLPKPGTFLELSPTEGWMPAYPLASEWRIKEIPESDELRDPNEGRPFWTNHKRVALAMLQHGESAEILADLEIIERAIIAPSPPAAGSGPT